MSTVVIVLAERIAEWMLEVSKLPFFKRRFGVLRGLTICGCDPGLIALFHYLCHNEHHRMTRPNRPGRRHRKQQPVSPLPQRAMRDG